jgi:CRP/FNR family transcriptional regulator, cyclic AMP receptor protein
MGVGAVGVMSKKVPKGRGGLSSNSRVYAHVMRSGLLASLAADIRADVVDRCQRRQFDPGTPLISQGEALPGLMIVATGQVEISNISPEGHRTVLHLANPGDVLGEMEVLADRSGVAHCVARTAVTVLICPSVTARSLLVSPACLPGVIDRMCARMERDNQLIAMSQISSAEKQVCHRILILTSLVRPTLKISQTGLAELVGCARETVNRVLAVLRADGLIHVGRAMIVVADRDGLTARKNAPDAPRAGRMVVKPQSA